MSAIDHAARAVKLLEHADQSESPLIQTKAIAAAQVHATLALVEQTRLANVIAYWQMHTPRSVEESMAGQQVEVGLLHDDRGVEIDTRVREGLDLA